jgi:hypothetical protein
MNDIYCKDKPMTNTFKAIDFDVDFSFDGALLDLAPFVSKQLFGGAAFDGHNTGIWDEVPAVRLCYDFLGTDIVLGGERPDYRLSFTVRNFPWDRISEAQKEDPLVSLHDYVMHLLVQIPGIHPSRPAEHTPQSR